MPLSLTQEFEFRACRERKGRNLQAEGQASASRDAEGQIPRVAKFMAIAIRLETMVRTHQVKNYAELARIGHVTTSRITQILNLCCLAPDIQEEILHLPAVHRGRAPVKLADLQPLAAMLEWRRQRAAWNRLKERAGLA